MAQMRFGGSDRSFRHSGYRTSAPTRDGLECARPLAQRVRPQPFHYGSLADAVRVPRAWGYRDFRLHDISRTSAESALPDRVARPRRHVYSRYRSERRKTLPNVLAANAWESPSGRPLYRHRRDARRNGICAWASASVQRPRLSVDRRHWSDNDSGPSRDHFTGPGRDDALRRGHRADRRRCNVALGAGSGSKQRGKVYALPYAKGLTGVMQPQVTTLIYLGISLITPASPGWGR